MIDYDKINEYVATMLSKSDSCCRLTNVALDDLFGYKNQVISERDLHEGIEYIIALHKKRNVASNCLKLFVIKTQLFLMR